jgi:hypothetical protein
MYDDRDNLIYNYFRDYDPATGRYVESDPIVKEKGDRFIMPARSSLGIKPAPFSVRGQKSVRRLRPGVK